MHISFLIQILLSFIRLIVSSTTPLSNSSKEFKLVEYQFLNGWPNELRSQVRVDAIHKINNSLLETQYQQFVRSNAKFATIECIGWHGTSAKCDNGKCMSPQCSLCQIVQNGFRKESARKDTKSYECWGNATYFADKSFVCQTYNGSSQINNLTGRRCTIMAKINHGHTIRGETLIETWHSALPLAEAIAKLNYDTVTVSRNYYIAPTDYLLLYNNVAAVPTYIVVYVVQTNALQVRKISGSHCSYHNEYHIGRGGCDGHWGDGIASCLEPGAGDYNGQPRENPYEIHLQNWYTSGCGPKNTAQKIEILKSISS